MILPANVGPERTGGREHDLTALPDDAAWLKFTKPWSAGYVVELSGDAPQLLPARPLQYLKRLSLQNRYFGDSIRFVGITADPKSRRIVIRQPDIQGRAPTWSEIDQWFERHQFKKLKIARLGAYDASAFGCEGIGVFDVRPANVVMTMAGELIPIDVMMRSLTKRQLARFSN